MPCEAPPRLVVSSPFRPVSPPPHQGGVMSSGKHWKYQSFSSTQSMPPSQQVGPPQLIPPHCPHSPEQSTSGSGSGSAGRHLTRRIFRFDLGCSHGKREGGGAGGEGTRRSCYHAEDRCIGLLVCRRKKRAAWPFVARKLAHAKLPDTRSSTLW